MPEIPEVTTTVRGLNDLVKNLTIEDVWSDWPKLIKSGSFADFKKEIQGYKILDAKRRAKNILIDLSAGKTLWIHMKMTGHIMYGKWREAIKSDKPGWKWIPGNNNKTFPLNDPYNRFIHILFFLSNGYQLALADMRKFAKVMLVNTNELKDHPDLKNLGPEPLDETTTITVFNEALRKKPSWGIKQALTNQETIAGIGNIYSDEILWECGIHPLQKVAELSDEEIKQIYLATKKILEQSINLGGDSVSDYRNIYGERGGYQNVHRVYRLTGTKCQRKNCGGTIAQIKVGSRTARFCDKHQKLR